MTSNRESKVERYLQARIKELGGMCLKWESPGFPGVPDRLVVLPGRPVFGVEVKTYDGRLTKTQTRAHAKLRHAGLGVVTVYGREGVDALLDQLGYA